MPGPCGPVFLMPMTMCTVLVIDSCVYTDTTHMCMYRVAVLLMLCTTQPYLSMSTLSAVVPCERDCEPYPNPWALSPESVPPLGPSVVSLIQYASVNPTVLRLSAPPCAPLFGPRVSAVRRPFPPCFIYVRFRGKFLLPGIPGW